MPEEVSKRTSTPAAIYLVLLVLVAAFFLTFFNRFAGLRSGNGEYTAGLAFLAGRLPYRDYLTTSPPLNTLKSALWLKLFGTGLIVTRSAAVAERLLIAVVLFRWLRQIFPPFPVLLASVVTVIVSAGDRTDPLSSYNHDAILWAMLSGLMASFVLSKDVSRVRYTGCSVLSGAFAALSVLTKQTVGLGSAVTVFTVLFLLHLRMGKLREGFRWVSCFTLGFLLPLAGVGLVLAHFHVLHAFLQMLFVKGPAAKAAHASDFLTRALRIGWDNIGWMALGGFGLLLGWRPIGRSLGSWDAATAETERPDPGDDEDLRPLWGVLLVGLRVIGLAELLRRLPALHDFSKSSVYFTTFAVLAALLYYTYRFLVQVPTARQAQCILFCAVSWVVAFTLSLSWPAFEAMVLPGLGFFLAAIVHGSRRRALPFVYAVLSLMVFMQTREKLDLPFGFNYQNEAGVRWADSSSSQQRLRGMLLPEQTVRFIDQTVAIIQANSRPADPILVYPEMGLIYNLSARKYPTLSGTQNIDVMNDRLAADEAARIRQARPAVIVYYRITEQQQRDAEALWRDGKPSGQRLLVRAVEDLIAGYRLAGSYRLAPDDPEILVYVRP